MSVPCKKYVQEVSESGIPDGQPCDAVYFRPAAVTALWLPILISTALAVGRRSVLSQRGEFPMQIPVWIKPGLWGAAGGAIAMATVGFSQLGWTTKGTAEQLAENRAELAVVSALVPFCVAKAQQDPEQAALAKFQTEQSSYYRRDIVMKAGWATVGGKTSPDNALARACSDKLETLKSG
jgi:hypothetical protein